MDVDPKLLNYRKKPLKLKKKDLRSIAQRIDALEARVAELEESKKAPAAKKAASKKAAE